MKDTSKYNQLIIMKYLLLKH